MFTFIAEEGGTFNWGAQFYCYEFEEEEIFRFGQQVHLIKSKEVTIILPPYPYLLHTLFIGQRMVQTEKGIHESKNLQYLFQKVWPSLQQS